MSDNQWNPALYQQKHSFVFEYGKDLLALLDARPGERILDVGCGTGQLTHSIAAVGANVVGMDVSPAMIETARRNFPELEFIVADASNFMLPEKFDAVFSNAALHWVTSAEAAVRCIHQALNPGGRFIAEFGGKGNVAGIALAIRQILQTRFAIETHHRWYFPAIGEYATLLEKHDFMVQQAHWYERPTKLEGEDGMRNWIIMFCAAMFQGLADDEQATALRCIEERLRTTHYRDGSWFADYTRLRVVAQRR
ncbi:MAG: methyltransferase domain-containing protein [Acidobacteria bacterium]|nr:methyltransferase domain-containing protein [Acidobacteriota bacterium]